MPSLMVITKIKKLDAKPLARCLPQHTQITPMNSILVVTVVTIVAGPTHLAGTAKERERGAVAAVPAAPCAVRAAGESGWTGEQTLPATRSFGSSTQRSPGRQLIRCRWKAHAARRYFKPRVSRPRAGAAGAPGARGLRRAAPTAGL